MRRYQSASGRHRLPPPQFFFVPCPRLPPFPFIIVQPGGEIRGFESWFVIDLCSGHRSCLTCARQQRWASLSTCASSFYPGSTRLSWISDLPRDARAPTVFTSQFFTSDTGEEWEACAAWGNAPAWWASSCCPRPSSAWSPTCCSSSRMGNNLKRIRSLWRSGSWVGWSEGASLWVQTNDLRTNKKVRALTVYSVNSETVWISMSVLFSLMCRLMNLSHVADAVPELLRYQGRGQGLLRHGLLWKSL